MIVSKIIKITQSRELSRKIVKCSRETDIIYDMTIMMKLAHSRITQFDVNNLITGWRREFNLTNSVRMHEAASKQAFQAAVKFRKANRLKHNKRIWRKKQIKLGKKKTYRHNRWTEPSSLMRRGRKTTRLRSLNSRAKPKLRDSGAVFLPGLGEARPRTKAPEGRLVSFQMIDTTGKVTRKTRDGDREFKLHLQIEVPDPEPATGGGRGCKAGLDLGVRHLAAVADEHGNEKLHNVPGGCKRHDGDAGQGSIRMFLEELHGVKLSAGAISHCRTAMARKLEGRAVDEPAVDGGCGRNPAAPRPIMGAILERASMDPHAATDETGGRVAGDAAQVLVSNTLHTTTIKVADSKGAADLRAQHNWMANRPAMRDGTSGFGWHNGPLGRCLVHVTRKSESLAIKHGHDSYQHVRHRMLLDVYKDAKKAAILITAAAGGQIRCASNLEAVSKVPGLAETVKQYTASLTDRVRMIIDSFEHDSLTTTLENALDNLFTGLRYPGMPLHNNSTELLIRRYIIPSRHRAPHPNKAAARNFSTHQTFIATCRKNGISPREAVLAMARDPCWDIFSSGIPPPIMTGAAAVSGRRMESAIPA